MPDRPQDWRIPVAVFWITSMVEALGVSQFYAFIPEYLRQMGLAEAERLSLVGLFGALPFVVGLPLVPLWGVWADKYSRRAVIARSAFVEAVVFAGLALAREPWQLAIPVLLVGLQLGNTGVMLATIRDVAPRARLGTIIGVFGAASPIGFAVGPLLGGWMIDARGLGIPAVYWLAAGLSVGTGLLVALGTREVRPAVIPSGRVLALAFGAMRGAVGDRNIRAIFAIYAVSFLANWMSRPFIPVVVERLFGAGPGLASAIGLVLGTAALAGALLAPVSGWLADRVGFRPVLRASLLAIGIALVAMAVAPSIGVLAVFAVVLAAGVASAGAMVFGLLATEVAPERRSATLNLVYLPLYAAGIVGPAIGGAVSAGFGPTSPFLVGAAVCFIAVAVLVVRRRGSAPAGVTPVDAG
ncbi:MAG TPA: MFS transporter [Candidatus Limnocylindrales bacterium]|nr:MFS transporter [Candidatus Limnocylindrales bacterium]